MASKKRRSHSLSPRLQLLEDRLAPAALDPNFGTQGRAVVEGFGFDPMADAAQDANERVIVVANTLGRRSVPHPFQVARFTATGVLDPLFGNGGKVTTSGFATREGNPANAYSDVVVTYQNQIFVAGTVNNDNDIAFVHYGESGNVLLQRTIDRGTYEDWYRVSDIAVDSSGNPLIAGRYSGTGGDHFFVLRPGGGLAGGDSWFYLPLDSSQYGDDGEVKITVMPNGQIVVGFAKLDEDTGKKELVALKLNSDLGFDSSFASNGFFEDQFGSVDNQVVPRYLLPQGNDILIVSDVTLPTGERYPGLWRLLSDGSLDNSFDVDGRALIDYFGTSWYEPGGARSATITPDGKIIVFGGSGHGTQTLMCRLNSDGSIDTTFGSFGIQGVNFYPPTYYTQAVGIMYQPNRNAFVVAAHVRGFDQNTDRFDLALARYFDGMHVSLSAPSHYASIGEGAELTARIFRDGVPIAGQVVHFEGKQDEVVVFTADVTTDSQGLAAVTHVVESNASIVYTANSGSFWSSDWNVQHVPADERLQITLTSLDGSDDDDKPDVFFPAMFSLFSPELAVLKATVMYDGEPVAGARVNLTSTAFASFTTKDGALKPTPDEPIGPPVSQTVAPTGPDGVTYFQYSSTTSHTDVFEASAVYSNGVTKSAATHTIHWRQVVPDLRKWYVYGFDQVTVRAHLFGLLSELTQLEYDADQDGNKDERAFPFRDVLVEFHVTSGPSKGNGEDRSTPDSRPNNWQLTDANGLVSFTYPVGPLGPLGSGNVDSIRIDPKSAPFADLRARASENGNFPFSVRVDHDGSIDIIPERATPTVGTELLLPVWHGLDQTQLEAPNFPTGFNIVYTVSEGPNAPDGPRTIDPPDGEFAVLTSGVPGTDTVFAEVFDSHGDKRLKTGVAWIEWRAQNTPAGSDVEVRPPIAGRGFAPFTLEFEDVTAPGDTTIEMTTAAPSGDDFRGFEVYQNGIFLAAFEIHTTATFTGPIHINYASDAPGNESTFKLVHFDGSRWVTVADDQFPDGLIRLSGTVNSLSPFAILVPELPDNLGSGNVKVKVYRGRLYVTGDDADNFIRIEAGDAGPESFRVIGIGTTINGQQLAQQFTGVRYGIVVNTGKGNDEVMLDGAAQGMQLKATTINTGLGNDVVRAIGITALGNFLAVTGLGDDSVEVVGSQFTRAVVILTSYGKDYVSFERTTFDRTMTVNTGRDDDYVAFRESVFGTVLKPGRFLVFDPIGLDAIDAGLLVTPNARGNQNAERLKIFRLEDVIT